MRTWLLFNVAGLTGLSLSAPAEKRSEMSEISMSHPIYTGPIESSTQALLDEIQPPEIVVLDVADFGNETIFASQNTAPSSDPDAPITAEEAQMLGQIVGADDRVEVDRSTYPWTTIGRLVSSNGVLCSGALVGSRLVSTARHCIDNQPAGTTWTFAPNYRNGPRNGQSGVSVMVYLGVDDYMDNCNVKYDWALLVLNDALGNNQGYLGAATWNTLGIEEQAVLHSAAYHGDKGMDTMWYHANIVSRQSGMTCSNYGPLRSNTDAVSGASGSALWHIGTDRYNLGALSMEVTSGSDAWVFHGWGEEFVSSIIDLRNRYP